MISLQKMLGGSIVNEWDQIVRHLSVASNEAQAFRLYDGTEATYWQSSGPQGKVSFMLYIKVIIIACYSTGSAWKFNQTFLLNSCLYKCHLLMLVICPQLL